MTVSSRTYGSGAAGHPWQHAQRPSVTRGRDPLRPNIVSSLVDVLCFLRLLRFGWQSIGPIRRVTNMIRPQTGAIDALDCSRKTPDSVRSTKRNVTRTGYDRLGVIGIVAMLVQATGAPAFSAASSGGNFVSQRTPRKRRPVTFPAASETSHRRGGTITSGWISLARSKPASSEIIGVFVTPPGTKTFTVTPVPSRSFAMIALSASSAALDGP